MEIGNSLLQPIYIQYFDIFTNEILDIKNFSHQFEKLSVLYTINSGIYGIVNKEWIIIGKLSKGKFNPEEYELPDFVFYNGKEYFVSRGDANTPIAELEPISKVASKVL
ncbi:Imm26 family immunity protein [Caldibacillus thermoamylovorans]